MRDFLEQMHTSDRWEIEPATLGLDDLDDELAAYNRYLAQLHAKESDRANRRPN